MFLQCSTFPVWEWPPEAQTLASSASSCYLQVKGEGLLVRCFPTTTHLNQDWNHMKRKAAAAFVNRDTPKQIKLLSERVVPTYRRHTRECKTDAKREWADVRREESKRDTTFIRKDTTPYCCLDNVLDVSRDPRSLQMHWIVYLTDEINPKINTSIWIRRIWRDLKAFSSSLISVMNDFPSNIELRSPLGTPVR